FTAADTVEAPEQPVSEESIKKGYAGEHVEAGGETETNEPPFAMPEATPSRVPPLYPIGQMHGTYILAQNERGLYIIDQHAAQERIKYEYFRDKVGEVATELQEMLVPITLEYSADECIKINEYQ